MDSRSECGIEGFVERDSSRSSRPPYPCVRHPPVRSTLTLLLLLVAISLGAPGCGEQPNPSRPTPASRPQDGSLPEGAEGESRGALADSLLRAKIVPATLQLLPAETVGGLTADGVFHRFSLPHLRLTESRKFDGIVGYVTGAAADSAGDIVCVLTERDARFPVLLLFEIATGLIRGRVELESHDTPQILPARASGFVLAGVRRNGNLGVLDLPVESPAVFHPLPKDDKQESIDTLESACALPDGSAILLGVRNQWGSAVVRWAFGATEFVWAGEVSENTASVAALAISGDSERVASLEGAFHSRWEVVIRKAASGEVIARVPFPVESSASLGFFADGTLVGFASSGRVLRVKSPEAKTVDLGRLVPPYLYAALHSDRSAWTLLVTDSGISRCIRSTSLAEGVQPVWGAIFRLGVMADGRVFAGTESGDVVTFGEWGKLPGKAEVLLPGAVTVLDGHPEGGYWAASESSQIDVVQLGLKGKPEQQRWNLHAASASAIVALASVAEGDRSLLCFRQHGSLQFLGAGGTLLDTKQLEPCMEWTIPELGTRRFWIGRRAAFSVDGRSLVYLDSSRRLRGYAIRPGETSAVLVYAGKAYSDAWGLAWDGPPGLVGVLRAGSVQLIEPSGSGSVSEITYPAGPDVSVACISPTGELIFVGDRSGGLFFASVARDGPSDWRWLGEVRGEVTAMRYIATLRGILVGNSLGEIQQFSVGSPEQK